MQAIAFPSYNYNIQLREGKEYIFDIVRKKWVRLTPEEWVRQNMLQYLLQVKKYPATLLAIEKEIQLGELRKRCDIVVYKEAQPWMIIECKEMKEALNEKVLQQVLRYNISLKVSFVVITNGTYCYGFTGTGANFSELENLPSYPPRT